MTAARLQEHRRVPNAMTRAAVVGASSARPPLTDAERPRRSMSTFIALLLALDHATLVWIGVDLDAPGRLTLLLVDILLAGVGFAVLILLGAYPLLRAVLTAALTFVSTAAAGPAAVAFFALARRRSAVQTIPVIALTALGAGVFELWFPVRGALSPVGSAMLVGVAYVLVALWGVRSGREAEALALQRSQMRMLEAVTDRRAEDARRRERSQMAAHLHDEFGHGLSLLVLAADEVALDASSRRTTSPEVAERLRTGVQRTIASYRATLDDLAPGEASVARTRWVEVTDFCDDIRRRLPAVTVTDDVVGAPPHHLSVLTLALLRESFTNAVKYATNAPIAVQLSGAADTGLRVTVENDVGSPHRGLAMVGHGSGLATLRRRVKGMGGRFEARPRTLGGFAVDAWLPWEATSALPEPTTHEMPRGGTR